ncbi:MAG: hypothetical protein IPM25_19345 [Chloracidobacterium sp.]|nr:hypothetical protein [Chloracidobacterium sp.]
MAKMNWERTDWEQRIRKSGSESVCDWKEELTGDLTKKDGKRKSRGRLARCSICGASLKPESVGRHDREIHGISDRQRLMDAGILPITKSKLKYGQWPQASDDSFVDRFILDIVDNDPTWERQGFVASHISSIAPRIMLRHKARSFVRPSTRCTLVCYSNDPKACEIARKIVEELASFVALAVKIETKKSKNVGDLVVYL